MSETTTKPDAAETLGPRTGQAQPPAPAGSSELAIRSGQSDWTDAQKVALVRQVGLDHADDSDLQLFFHYASRTGLDPFTRQVYMVGRDTEITVREKSDDTGNEREVKRRVTKFTIQVGIDGWRVLGNRAAHRDGVRVGHKRPLYAGKDGVWTSIWLDEEPPLACEYAITAGDVEVTAVCYYAEYVQTTYKDGKTQPNSMWRKMPLNQLAKCAEALAWRKAFPADFSGLVLEDAAQAEVIDGEIVEDPVKTAPKRARGADRVKERARAARHDEPATDRQRAVGAIFERLAEGKITEGDDRRIAMAELAGLKDLPQDLTYFTDKQLAELVIKLDRMSAAATEGDGKSLEAQLDDVLRSWEYRQGDEAQS